MQEIRHRGGHIKHAGWQQEANLVKYMDFFGNFYVEQGQGLPARYHDFPGS